jgi:hypothetical protein
MNVMLSCPPFHFERSRTGIRLLTEEVNKLILLTNSFAHQGVRLKNKRIFTYTENGFEHLATYKSDRTRLKQELMVQILLKKTRRILAFQM